MVLWGLVRNLAYEPPGAARTNLKQQAVRYGASNAWGAQWTSPADVVRLALGAAAFNWSEGRRSGAANWQVMSAGPGFLRLRSGRPYGYALPRVSGKGYNAPSGRAVSAAVTAEVGRAMPRVRRADEWGMVGRGRLGHWSFVRQNKREASLPFGANSSARALRLKP